MILAIMWNTKHINKILAFKYHHDHHLYIHVTTQQHTLLFGCARHINILSFLSRNVCVEQGTFCLKHLPLCIFEFSIHSTIHGEPTIFENSKGKHFYFWTFPITSFLFVYTHVQSVSRSCTYVRCKTTITPRVNRKQVAEFSMNEEKCFPFLSYGL